MSLLTQQTLIDALKATTAQVKLLSPTNGLLRYLDPAKALELASRGGYEGLGKPKRVKALRIIDLRPPRPWAECWRTTQAAVLPPSAEYLAGLSGIGKARV